MVWPCEPSSHEENESPVNHPFRKLPTVNLRRRYTHVLAGVTAVFVAALASPAIAIPDPSLLRESRDDAPEILLLSIQKVTPTSRMGDTTEYRVTATVLSVHRSVAGYQKGDSVTFDSYTVAPDAARRGFVGPKSPPKLFENWVGWAYLSDESGNGLGPAAYGDSFRSVKRRRR